MSINGSKNDALCHVNMPFDMLVSQEQAFLNRWLKNVKNLYVVQLGNPPDCWPNSRGMTVLRVVDTDSPSQCRSGYVKADFMCLPIRSESVDVVLISHAVTSENVVLVLKECNRILKSNGQLILLGLNNIGIWRWCYLMGCQKHFFKKQTFLSAYQIKTQLQELEMEIIFFQTICFRPPFKDRKLVSQFMVIDVIGQFLFPSLGASFMMVASKQIGGLTIVPVVENRKQVQWAAGQVRQTTRNCS